MFSFLLDPPSGYSGSYYDNKFSIKFDTSYKTEISFLNEQTKQLIEILSVDDGYIYNENTIILLNSNKVNGYINLFNKDKMNERLNDFFSVNITCQINYIDDKNNNIKTEKETLTFYNESKSLDINIIPFDLKIEKNSITDEEDLKLFFTCDTEQKFELSIKSSATSINKYTFEVFTKQGITEINIPIRMIISDLNIPINTNREFDIYWTKFEGVNYQKFYNRKFVKIPNTKLKIIHKDFMSHHQPPIGILGEKLSSDFVLSDRYLVHTHKSFSGFGSIPINMNKIKKMVMLHNEAQTMQKIGRNIESSQIDIEHQNNLQINRKEIRNSTKISEPLNRNFYEIYMNLVLNHRLLKLLTQLKQKISHLGVVALESQNETKTHEIILKAITEVCKKNNIIPYLYGNILKYELTKNGYFISLNNIEIILSYSDSVNINFLYNQLSEYITINKELENNKSEYSFISNNFIVKLSLKQNFDCNTISGFTIDSLYKNLITDEIIDPTKSGLNDIQNKPVVIKTTTNFDNNFLNLLNKLAHFENVLISENDLNKFKKINLNDLNSDTLIFDILTAYHPGNVFTFLIQNFDNAYIWIWSKVVDFAIKNNIILKENLSPKDVFSTEKMNLLNLYNEFFLFDKTSTETVSEKNTRLTSTLRLLFDSPNLTIENQYIGQTSLFNLEDLSNNSSNETIRLFENPCQYGECPDCNPETCSPQCCCCHSTDIVSEVKFRCHKQVVISCNSDGSGYGTKEDELFSSCSKCTSACASILGNREDLDGEGCSNFTSIGTNEEWWNLPSSYWPCECDCKANDGDTCTLTCVTCNNLFCESKVNVTGNDCNYNISLTPGYGCCGPAPIFDIVFAVDISNSMTGKLNSMISNISNLTTFLQEKNAISRFALVTFSDDNIISTYTWDDSGNYNSSGTNDFTQNSVAFSNFITAISLKTENKTGEPLFDACSSAMHYSTSSSSKILFVITDESDSSITNTFIDVVNEALVKNYRIFYVGPINNNEELSIQTNGKYYNIFDSPDYAAIFSEIAEFNYLFPSSCDCIDSTPIKLKRQSKDCMCCKDGVDDPCIDDPTDQECTDNLPDSCFDIAITKCFPGQTCDCSTPIALNACGTTIIIEPKKSNLQCCSDIGFGCDCGSPTQAEECCGPECHDLCSMYKENPDINALIDFVWNDCWSKKVSIDTVLTPNCTDPCCPDPTDTNKNNYPCELREQNSDSPCCPCLLENQKDCCNCCIKFLDDSGEPTITYCRQDIAQKVRNIIAECSVTPPPPPPWDPPNTKCRADRCIVGDPQTNKDKTLDDQCDLAEIGCSRISHPSTVVLNNGIGLIAYETSDTMTSIKIQQFSSSVGNKILPNREMNFGRLQNKTKWINNSAKLYIYDQLPEHLLSGISESGDQSLWKDAIGFKTGPLEKQFFALTNPSYGTDEIGKYIQFFVPENTRLTNNFSSPDDAYNVKYFVFDMEDDGVIGEATDTSTDGSKYIINNRQIVDSALVSLQHIYNGKEVPVAYPSITTAYNYSNYLENSHFVYLAYQALEDEKWNIYLREIRLSEYEKQEQITDAIEQNNLITLNELQINDLVYKIICVSDSCSSVGDNKFLVKRTVVMDINLYDGREVFNPNLTGYWNSLCAGHASTEFEKRKVFVQFVHSAIVDRCPDRDILNQMFFNWQTGQEFIVPYTKLTADNLFSIISVSGDTSIPIGTYESPVSVDSTLVYSSSVGALWYNDIDETNWSVVSDTAFNRLLKFKGLDINEPILISENDSGHCTRPVVKTNYNNQVFICYENTNQGLQQIKLVGTQAPSSSLPIGVFVPRQIDRQLDYFLKPTDFIYSHDITTSSINQHPSMFIDYNDVIHLTWHSNKNIRWEIYYAKSDNEFEQQRITNYEGKSLNPTISGDNFGKLYITWHDNRFGDGYEIMMAHYNGDMVTPLSQQDPYLASIRNSGYKHYLDEIPITISNTTNNVICTNNIIVDFYLDRTLSQLAFTIQQNNYPELFSVPGAKNDNTTTNFNEFSNWTDTILSGTQTISTSIEFDTFLTDSELSAAVFSFNLNNGTSTEVSFRGSNTENDSLSSSQWTEWATISSQTYLYSQLGLGSVRGRYKQVRFRFTYSGTKQELLLVQISSESQYRLCLAPGSTQIAIFTLNPTLRIDNAGNEIANFPVPLRFIKNNTYFVKVRIETNDGDVIDSAEQNTSMSCESCHNSTSLWNYDSCSIKSTIENNNDEIAYYNFELTFYFDKELLRPISTFRAFPDSSDLQYFSINNNESAQNSWSARGLKIDPQTSSSVVFWPNLNQMTGLLCGIEYYVVIKSCYSTISSTTSICDNLSNYQTIKWVCNCLSNRWATETESGATNLWELNRWVSSGSGFSDTRLTATVNSYNINPKIQMQSNRNGVIIYETNRSEFGEIDSQNKYKLYACIFTVIPSDNMYASAAQSIISPFGSIIFRSDIPICETKDITKIGCYDNNNQKINNTIVGQNTDFSIDQYDNIFLATEKIYINLDGKVDCNQFSKNKQTYVSVHTCGMNPLNLFENTIDDSKKLEACLSPAIFNTTYISQSDPIFNLTNNLIHVRNEFVSYHITQNNINIPVVLQCNIGFTVIAVQETISIRLRNSTFEWSDWIPLKPEIGENTINIDWRLTPESGLKLVEIQASTLMGMSQVYQINILADYNKVSYEVNFYKTPSNFVFPPETVDITQESIWNTENLLPQFESQPVASMRSVYIKDNVIQIPQTDYIFVEIIPSNKYMEQFLTISDDVKKSGESNIEPFFSFTQQGEQEIYNLSTKWSRNNKGQEVFRGVIQIFKQDNGKYKDGFAFITPVFKNDCSQIHQYNQTQKTEFAKDKFNIIANTSKNTNDQTIPFDRDDNGLIKYKSTIRSNEDPYFIFGDPNYTTWQN